MVICPVRIGETLGSIPRGLTLRGITGMRETVNPLGWGPRYTQFDSGIPDKGRVRAANSGTTALISGWPPGGEPRA